MSQYDFTKQDVSMYILLQDINSSSSISQNVDSWSRKGDVLSIFFQNELITEEQTALATIVTNHVGGNGQFYREIYHIDYYESGKKTAEEWYETDNGDETYSGKARRIKYTWSGNKLIQEDEYVYCTNGAVWFKNSYKYYTNGTNIIKKPV